MKNLRDCSLAELETILETLGEPKYRAKQVHEWMWKKHAGSLEAMSNLPKTLRDKLSEQYNIPKVTVHHSSFSSDGTIKNRLQLHDKHFVE
ncbi:MAG: 23S rRNA (adenine(2503)-C(2))-methyltransferase RlmN, partial [Chitinophagia bacterium]|nr:23S rRNA (adenine(2503)-C(2))-methyltransferase RlmN [Chitinophagia bacterium]